MGGGEVRGVTTEKGTGVSPGLSSPRCWDLNDSSPYWWIIKGPIVLSVAVCPWASVLLLYSANLPGPTKGPYTVGNTTPGCEALSGPQSHW